MQSRDDIDYCEHGENEMVCLKCQLKREREYNSQLRAEKDQLLAALKMAYRKHHLHDESIGWEELSTVMHDALCEAMGDKEYILWLGGL